MTITIIARAGTGKTATLSAYAGSLLAAGLRVLILAPANAATLRVLESVVAQNMRFIYRLIRRLVLFLFFFKCY